MRNTFLIPKVNLDKPTKQRFASENETKYSSVVLIYFQEEGKENQQISRALCRFEECSKHKLENVK